MLWKRGETWKQNNVQNKGIWEFPITYTLLLSYYYSFWSGLLLKAALQVKCRRIKPHGCNFEDILLPSFFGSYYCT